MLNPISENVWEYRYEFSIPGAKLPTRSTIVRLSGGDLLLYSPGPFGDDTAAELAKLGEVRHLVAPNSFHHVYLNRAKRRFPEASVYASDALLKKRSDLGDATRLEQGLPEAWSQDLDLVVLEGARNGEAVLYHRPSRSLIVADLVFNIRNPRGWAAPLVFRMTGTYNKLAFSRLFGMLVNDKPLFQERLKRVVGWDVERLIPGHGEIVSENAGAQLNQVLSGVLS